MKFEDLKIAAPILKAVREKGYTEPTPIQEKAIPQILQRRDVLGCAQTGTGKTAAFAIPIIQLINEREGKKEGRPILRSLIVTPTRELAIQIEENIKEYGKNTNIKHAVIFGGVKQGRQVESLKNGVHILVATPGRLLDLINQGFISLEEVKLFVLDEADRMLDMGFIHDIRKLLQLLPQKRQSLFFSATMPKNIVELANKILTNPVKVEVTPASTTAETVSQHVLYTNKSEKRKLLHYVLVNIVKDQTLVFTRTKHGADRVARDLKKKGINSASIHGDKAQNQRQKALRQFKEGIIRVLVATDIAARGIDIDKLKYVINYEIPNLPETYVHRIGRSGRAGEEGFAYSLCEPEENIFVKDIEKLTGQKLNVVQDHPHPQTDKPMTPEEKKEWEKEKQRKKQEFFANRKKRREQNKPKSKSNQNAPRNGRKQNSQNKVEGGHQGDGTKEDEGVKRPKEPNKNAQNKRKKNKNNGPNQNGKRKNSSKKKMSTNERHKKRGYTASLSNKFMWPLE